MGGNNIRFWVICWMLDWAKFVNFSSLWYNNDSPRMLPCGSLNSCTTLCKASNFCTIYWCLSFFKIFSDKRFCCFISNGSYRSCFKGSSFSKNNFCIAMCFCLIFSEKSLSQYLVLCLHQNQGRFQMECSFRLYLTYAHILDTLYLVNQTHFYSHNL